MALRIYASRRHVNLNTNVIFHANSNNMNKKEKF